MKRKVIFNLETKDINKRSRTITFIGSNDVVDRTGEIVTLDGWDIKSYKKNPVFLWAHKYGDPPIGKSLQTRIKKDEGLMFKIEFASREVYPFADVIFNLYVGGFLNAVSVGYIPKELNYDTDKDQLYITKKELLELSAVPVPANPEALQNGFGMDEMNDAVKKDVINIQEAYEFMREADLWKKAFDKNIQIVKCNKCQKDKAQTIELKVEPMPDPVPADLIDDKLNNDIKELNNHVNIYKNAFKSVDSAKSKEIDEDLKTVKDLTDKLWR